VVPNGRMAHEVVHRNIAINNYERSTFAAILLGQHTDSIYALVSLPNNRLASGSTDKTICIWDVDTGECLGVLKGHTNSVSSLVALPNGHLASGSHDKTIRIWDLTTSECVSVLKGHTRWVTSLAVLPDGRLISGSSDRTIRVWDDLAVRMTAMRHKIEQLEAKLDACLAKLNAQACVKGSE